MMCACGRLKEKLGSAKRFCFVRVSVCLVFVGRTGWIIIGFLHIMAANAMDQEFLNIF